MIAANPQWTELQHTTCFVNPTALRAPVPETVTVNDDGTVTLFGDIYRPAQPLRGGTVLTVSRGPRGNLAVCPASEVDRAEQARAKDAAEAAAERAQAFDQKRQENRDANQRLNIPATWLPEANPYMTTEWNGPHGRPGKRGAVYHIRLTESLHEGRLHREPGDTLCANRSKWGDLFDITERNPQAFEDHQVTCRACLTVAARWAGAHPSGPDKMQAAALRTPNTTSPQHTPEPSSLAQSSADHPLQASSTRRSGPTR